LVTLGLVIDEIGFAKTSNLYQWEYKGKICCWDNILYKNDLIELF